MLVRSTKNPLIVPSSNWWEEKSTFNPGATIYKNKVYLLYRAQGNDNISRLGLAISEDGIKFERREKPLIEGEEEDQKARLGVEDPRISKIGDRYYIVFTEASVYPADHEGSTGPSLASKTPWRIRLSCISTTDFKTFRHEAEFLPRTDSKDGALFPEKHGVNYVLLHRIYPDLYITFSTRLDGFDKGFVLFKKGELPWASERVGAGGPPIKTDKGWLVFFHGVDDKRVYRLGAMLLDLKDPRKVISIIKESLLEPEENYEKEGNVEKVVFTCGVVEKDDNYFLYYGAADKVIGLATIEKEKLLSSFK